MWEGSRTGKRGKGTWYKAILVQTTWRLTFLNLVCGKRQDVRELTNDNVKYLEGIQTIASDGDNVREEVEEGYDVECCTVGEHHEVFSSRDKSD